jgi:proteasome beta subunit
MDDPLMHCRGELLRQGFSDLSGLPPDLATVGQYTSHGTTIGAISVDHGERVVAFSDGKVSVQERAFELTYDKIFPVDDYSCLLISGVLEVGNVLVSRLRTYIGIYEDADQRSLTARAKVNFIEDFQRQSLSLALRGLVCMPIFVTYDQVYHQRSRIFITTPGGATSERNPYCVLGSGSADGDPVLDELTRRELKEQGTISLERGLSMAQKILERTAEKDNHSGGRPTFKIIDRDGVHVHTMPPHEEA